MLNWILVVCVVAAVLFVLLNVYNIVWTHIESKEVNITTMYYTRLTSIECSFANIPDGSAVQVLEVFKRQGKRKPFHHKILLPSGEKLDMCLPYKLGKKKVSNEEWITLKLET